MRRCGVGLLHLAVALSLSQMPAGAQTAGGGGQARNRRPFRARVTASPTCRASGRRSPPPTTACCRIPRARTVPPALGVVEGDEIPYRPEALAKKQENFANRATRDTEAKCYLPGVPRITYMPFPFQIIQMPDVTTILYEYLHAIRYIYTNGSQHPRGPTRLVDGRFTRPLGGGHAGRRRGSFRRARPGSTGPATSTAMRCTSSSATRLMDADHINYEVTIEDPKVFTRPWKMRMVLYRRKEPNFQLLDYDCYAFEWEKYYPYPGL